jgi:hypothetical protein
MESKIYNTVSKRYLQIDGQQYKNLLNQGYYIDSNNQLTSDIISKSKKSPITIKSSKKSKTKTWVVKSSVKTKSPIKSPINTLYKTDAFINVVRNLTPNDILSLYISNKDVVFDQVVLDYLSNRYKVDKVKTLAEFINLYNLSIVDPYLYQLEYKVEMPTQYVMQGQSEVSQKMRAILYDWLLQINIKFKTSIYVMGLTMTLLDSYLMKKDITKNNLQGIGCMCHHLACQVLEEYSPDMGDYGYIVDGAYDTEKLENFRTDIINVLHGVIIRPSTIFFADINNEDIKNFVMISYTIVDLLLYKPSLVAEAINYIVTGYYKIYSLGEISRVCRKLIPFIKRMHKTSLSEIKKCADKLSNYDNYQCGLENSDIKESPFKYNNEWHIGEYEKIAKIGEGTYGKVIKIKRKECNKDYVVKSSISSFESATLELSVLKLLNSYNPEYIINLCGFNIPSNERINLYLPYMDNTVDKLLDNNTFNFNKFPIYAKQMITGLYECHRCDLIHRDIKLNNIVYNALEDVFKIIDFGLTVTYASKRKSLDPDIVSTYPYRAPEAFFGLQYNNKVDIWALGCVFYYIITKKHIIDVNKLNDKNALNQIFQLFGTPTEEEWSGITLLLQENNIPVYPKNDDYLRKIFKQYYDFIMPCFQLNPATRPDTVQLLSILKNKY